MVRVLHQHPGMNAFRHILVPTDFEEASEQAFELALEIATRFGSKITLFHSTWLPPYYYSAYAEGLAWPTDELENQSKKKLDATVAAARLRWSKVDGHMVGGETWEKILEAIEQYGVDLVILGTHGRRGVSRALLGSVAEKIVRLSPVPVMTVCPRASQEAAEREEKRKDVRHAGRAS